MDDATTSQAAMDPVWEQAVKNEEVIKDKGYDELLADADLQHQILSDFYRYGQQGEWVFERLLFKNVGKDVAKYIILYRSEDGNIDRVSTYSKKRASCFLTATNLYAASCCQGGRA